MPKDIKQKKNRLSDEELNRVLTEWAEGEVPVPDEFHPQLMAKLHAQASEQEKEKVLPFFVRNKKWMSVAAAAVFAVICIPVVQTQMAVDPTDPEMQRPSTQHTGTVVGETFEESEDENLLQNETDRVEKENADKLVVIPQNSQHTVIGGVDDLVQNGENRYPDGGNLVPKPDATVPEGDVIIPDQPVIPDRPEDEIIIPKPGMSMPAFPLSSAFESGSNGLYSNENNNDAMIQTYQDAIREVDQKLVGLYRDLAICDKKIAASPGDVSLKATRTKITNKIASLEKEREQINGMISELRR